ncbi:MAG TPA: ABC transporter ATP-binding protein [Chloroflexota bacterium]|nr:ABC transporter ATP-binding protein [Chloroflexota bacterium]
MVAESQPEAPVGETEDEVLLVKDLKTYFRTMDGVVKAVDGVSFDIPAGSSVGIVGESGCGKSVTSLSIMRLVERPGWIAGGSIFFQGKDILKLDDRAIRRIRGDRISMVFQEPMTSLNPVYTVGDQVAEVIRAHRNISRKDAMSRTVELFHMVGIPNAERRIKEYPHNFSGGQRQRIMIAMALANDPDLLILDEPTTALDVTVQAQILELVKDLRQRVNTAVVLITHDLGVVAEMSERVIVMYSGRVVEDGTAVEVLKDPLHPYTKGLLSSIPSLGKRNERLNVIAGAVPNPLRLPQGCKFAPRCPFVMDVCWQEEPELKAPEKREGVTGIPDGSDRAVRCWLYE